MQSVRGDAVKALLVFATSSHSLEISCGSTDGGDASDIELVTSKAVASFEPVASIQWSCLLDSYSAKKLLADFKVLPGFASEESAHRTSLLDVDCISLALAIAKAQMLPQYRQYIDALPSNLPGLQWHLNLEHAASESNKHGEDAMPMQHLKLLAGAWRSHIAATFASYRERLEALGVSESALKWAYAMFLSRAMRVPNASNSQTTHCAAMVPVGDMANHESSSPAHWRLHTRVLPSTAATAATGRKKRRLLDAIDDVPVGAGASASGLSLVASAPTTVDELQLVPGRNVAKGGRITIPYGRKGGDTLMMNFGFLDPTPGVTSLHVQAFVCPSSSGKWELQLSPLTLLPEATVHGGEAAAPSLFTDFPLEAPCVARGSDCALDLLQQLVDLHPPGRRAPPYTLPPGCIALKTADNAESATLDICGVQYLRGGALQLSSSHGSEHILALTALASAAPLIVQRFASDAASPHHIIVKAAHFHSMQNAPCSTQAAALQTPPMTLLEVEVVVDSSASSSQGAAASEAKLHKWSSRECKEWTVALSCVADSVMKQLAEMRIAEASLHTASIGSHLSLACDGGPNEAESHRLAELVSAWSRQRLDALDACVRVLKPCVI